MINVASKSSGDLSPVVQPAHEFLLFPNGARSFKQAMHMGVSVYHEVNKLIKSSGVGNDGGFSPYKLYSTDGQVITPYQPSYINDDELIFKADVPPRRSY